MKGEVQISYSSLEGTVLEGITGWLEGKVSLLLRVILLKEGDIRKSSECFKSHKQGKDKVLCLGRDEIMFDGRSRKALGFI